MALVQFMLFCEDNRMIPSTTPKKFEFPNSYFKVYVPCNQYLPKAVGDVTWQKHTFKVTQPSAQNTYKAEEEGTITLFYPVYKQPKVDEI